MKKTITIMLIALLTSALGFSQEGKEHQYIFSGNGDNPVKVSGFASVFTQFSTVRNEFAVSNGGGAAILFNQKVFFGGYGEGVSTRHDYSVTMADPSNNSNITYDDLRIRMGHGGFWLGYIATPHKAVHFTAGSKIGFGAITVHNDNNDTYKQRYDDRLLTDKIFVLEPEVGVEFNLLKWFRINVAVGYRYVSGVSKEYKYNEPVAGGGAIEIDKTYFEKDDFNSITGSVNLVFGWFHQ